MSGSAFQVLAVATGKARLPIVDSLERWYGEMVGSGRSECVST